MLLAVAVGVVIVWYTISKSSIAAAELEGFFDRLDETLMSQKVSFSKKKQKHPRNEGDPSGPEGKSAESLYTQRHADKVVTPDQKYHTSFKILTSRSISSALGATTELLGCVICGRLSLCSSDPARLLLVVNQLP